MPGVVEPEAVECGLLRPMRELASVRYLLATVCHEPELHDTGGRVSGNVRVQIFFDVLVRPGLRQRAASSALETRKDHNRCRPLCSARESKPGRVTVFEDKGKKRGCRQCRRSWKRLPRSGSEVLVRRVVVPIFLKCPRLNWRPARMPCRVPMEARLLPCAGAVICFCVQSYACSELSQSATASGAVRARLVLRLILAYEGRMLERL